MTGPREVVILLLTHVWPEPYKLPDLFCHVRSLLSRKAPPMERTGRWAMLWMAVLPSLCLAAGEKPDELLLKTVRVPALREWKYLVVHHTATETGSVESIDAAHKLRKDAAGNPWRGIGYHFLIGNGHGMKDGEVAATFRWKEQADGAHAGNAQYNSQGVGICLVGNFEDASPTPAQLKSLRQLMATLQTECRISPDGIVRHADVKQTACPGKHFPWNTLLSARPTPDLDTLVNTAP